jgi:hypothetical protein
MLAFIWSLNYFLLIRWGMRRHTIWRFISLVNTLIDIGVACLLLHHSFGGARFRVDPQGLLKFLIIDQRIHFHPDWRLYYSLWTLVVVGWWWGIFSVTATIRTHKWSTTGDVIQISIDLIPVHLKHRERYFLILNSQMWYILLLICLLHWERMLNLLLSVMYKEIRAIPICLAVLQSIGVVRDYL